MKHELQELLAELALLPHPEGGYYRETYRSIETAAQLPARFNGPRCLSTAILFLLDCGGISRMHRLKSDELWHFHDGEPLEVISIDPSGKRVDHLLGRSWRSGQNLQVCIPAGHWFGARVLASSGWSLVGCTVAPGFEFSDFELGKRSHLATCFPDHAAIIRELTAPD